MLKLPNTKDKEIILKSSQENVHIGDNCTADFSSENHGVQKAVEHYLECEQNKRKYSLNFEFYIQGKIPSGIKVKEKYFQ